MSLVRHMLPQRSGCAGLGVNDFLSNCSADGGTALITINWGCTVVNGCGVTISGTNTVFMDVCDVDNDPFIEASWEYFADTGPMPYSHGPGTFTEYGAVIEDIFIPYNYAFYRVRQVRTETGYPTIYRVNTPDYICGTS